MTLIVQTWRIDRASEEWVGPFDIAAMVAGQLVDLDPSSIRIACLPKYKRPGSADDPAWRPFDIEPGGNRLGYMTSVVSKYERNGFWALIADMPEIAWREPHQVGWLNRT